MGNQSSKKIKYKVPPGASKPDPPGKPVVEYIGDDVVVRWSEPGVSGGCPIIGYVLQFNRVDGILWESYRVTGTECVLQNLDDTFIFRVIAENIIGYSEPSETSLPVSFEFTEPTLLVPLNTQIRAIEFEKVELHCRIWGMPSPEITWFLNGEEIFSDNRVFVRSDGVDHKLIFHHVKISDEGQIRVHARNVLGETESTASVVVEAPPRIKTAKSYDDGIISRVGENLRLRFAFTGRPRPEVTWYHEGEIISGKDKKIEEIGDVTILNIDSVKRQDAGEYTLRIENNIGEDVSHVLVTVIDKPQPPGKPIVILMPDNSCLLEWESGNEEIVGYIVEYFRDGWGVWLKALATRNRGCKIRDLIPGSKYTFRAKAENHFGISDPGEESVQIFIPESKKEHGSVMSSIQEDEFEIFSELKPNSSNERLEAPPLPAVRKPVARPDPTKSATLFSNLRKVVDSAQKSRDFLSPEDANLVTKTLSVPRLSGHDSASSDTDSLRDNPSPVSGQRSWRGTSKNFGNRNQLIGNMVSKSDDSLSSASSSKSDSRHKIFDHYGKPGRGTRGADRFEKYRKDNRSDPGIGKHFTLGSDKGSCDDLESAIKDNNFVIVEDGGEEMDDESADFVVSQLVVPVKQGNVKISTSFDGSSVAASSVKSSFDDLSSNDGPILSLSRMNTPDQFLQEIAEPAPELEPDSDHEQESEPAVTTKASESAPDNEGDRTNLLYHINEEIEAMKKDGTWRQSRDSLSRGGSRSRATSKSPTRLDGLLSRDENSYIGRYGTGGRLSMATLEKLYGKGNAEKSRMRSREQSREPQDKNVKMEANAHASSTPSNVTNANTQDRKIGDGAKVTTQQDVNGAKSATGVKSNSPPCDTSDVPERNKVNWFHMKLSPRVNSAVDHVCVLLVLCMLSPLLLLNPLTVVLFCLLLIKMTWM